MNTQKSRNILAVSLMAAGLTFFSISNLSAQEHKSCCGDGMEKDVVAMNGVSGDSTKKMDMKHDMHNQGKMKMGKEKTTATASVVREGKIDLKAIDQNKDGKVFQCPMDWNVISDASGKCPTCKMKLKEVSLNEAKKNLKENGYKVK